MSGYRQVHTQIWKDEWIIELEPLEKYLFIYLFTNELSSISGIFKLPLKVIENETGLKRDFIERTLAKFQAAQKIAYGDGVIWVVNMSKWHSNASPKTRKRVETDADKIPDCSVKKAYLYYIEHGIYSIDTVSIPVRLNKSVSLIKEKDKDEDKAEVKETNSAQQQPTDKFDQIQRWLEKNVGLPAANAADVEAIQELCTLELIEDDIKDAIGWLRDQAGKTANRYSTLLNPIKTSYAKRIQKDSGNGNGKKESTLDRIIREETEKERIRNERGY